MAEAPISNRATSSDPTPEVLANSEAKDEAGLTPVKGSPNGTSTGATKPGAKRNRKPNRPNYALIHSKPLPLTVYPLPDFHPTNPISLLRFAYIFLSHIFAAPSSHLRHPYTAYLSLETRSIHVTDSREIRALWAMGFFGKGTLSRSEPSWMDREKARLLAKRSGGKTAEEVTQARREERKIFKLERARAEREKIERQRMVEEGRMPPSTSDEALVTKGEEQSQAPVESPNAAIASRNTPDTTTLISDPPASNPDTQADIRPVSTVPADTPLDIQDQEHLQLTLEEAFFLHYGLGVLSLQLTPSTTSSPASPDLTSNHAILQLFCNLYNFPSRPLGTPFAMDDQFLLSYLTYHHFRSLGWVIRPGIKFSVDYMLYHRGPAFSHAEFAVVIMPAYSDAYWSTAAGEAARRVKHGKDWWWLHCVNRVQSQVFKSLVLVYVEVPPPRDDLTKDLGALLRAYTVREFVVKRWLVNRSRD